uniref:Anaphase-promoting complex subunit 4 WD40 domain-containing protein n=1 Tax=Oryza rufipogon TaxID=4529 RepID=A0A0E0N5I7_ORYRU
MLAPRSLRKAAVPPSLLSDPSPGSLQPTRLAVHVNAAGSSCSAYLASGCRVYKIEIAMEGEMLSKGKESLLIPINAEVISSSVVDRCPHRSEIQSVVLAEGEGDGCLILGTVDSYGHLIVSRLDTVADGPPIQYHLVIVVSEKEVGLGYVAVARELCKCIDIYDQDIHVRSLRTLWYPSSFSFAQCMPQVNESGSMLAIAEGSQLSIWDLRTSNNGGCIHRISGPIGGIIYSLCSSPSGPIAVGGTDRTVTIYDPRRWSALSRWVGCSKYEITGLSFSSVDESFIYVQGVDYEITCGLWKGNERAFSFRGDSNWLGFSKCANTDVVAGWCESGSVFVADVRQDCLSVIGPTLLQF